MLDSPTPHPNDRPGRHRRGSRRRNSERTRAAILDAAEARVLEHGFGATTVEAIIEGAGVTKGAFFHHFESKRALGRALVERYAERDEAFLQAAVERAERSYADPLQRVLYFVALFEEEMESLVEPFPGSLFASYSYQAELFDADTMEVVRGGMIRWRRRFEGMLEAAARRHPPRGRPDLEALADMLTVVLEGAFILSRGLDEPQAVARQLSHFRRYLELRFDPA